MQLCPQGARQWPYEQSVDALTAGHGGFTPALQPHSRWFQSVRRAQRQSAPAWFHPSAQSLLQHDRQIPAPVSIFPCQVASHGQQPVLTGNAALQQQGMLSLLHAGCVPRHQQRSRSVLHPFAPGSQATSSCRWKLLSEGGCAHLHLCLRLGSAGCPADPRSRWLQDRPSCTPLPHSAFLKHSQQAHRQVIDNRLFYF